MPSDHQDNWGPGLVWVNTLATLLGGMAGFAALVIALIALFRSGC
jgi:hypothetical protein